MLNYSILFLASLLTLCFAGALTPLEPAPGDQFTEGGSLTISWTADTTGAWKETNIELMTGDNFNMRHLTTLATIDGTDATKTSLSVPCPFATPPSPIYFLQFSAVGQVMWTGRFSIVGSGGKIVPPSNTTQPDGSNIPWGIGTLVSPSFPGSPPPSTAPSGQIDASGSSASSSSSASSGVSPASGSSSASGSNPASDSSPTSSSDSDPTSGSNTSPSPPSPASSNATEGLGASAPSSTSGSGPLTSSIPTVRGPLPGETTTSVGSSTSSQPSGGSDQSPNANSTNNTNHNSAIAITRSYITIALVPMLIITFISGNSLS